ncbi:uncharacterized protein G2W53_022062 [Senna tora]|uniref:Uncharacterized protein n=1 Tax=Senna tora TaxID=362788 RepID=A0A834TKL0_9FABA|nr:uncharacterized protein G2W53_022062 [Senna tora]
MQLAYPIEIDEHLSAPQEFSLLSSSVLNSARKGPKRAQDSEKRDRKRVSVPLAARPYGGEETTQVSVSLAASLRCSEPSAPKGLSVPFAMAKQHELATTSLPVTGKGQALSHALNGRGLHSLSRHMLNF